jgi:hypothetical protein
VVSERVDAPVEAVEVKTVVPPEPIAAQEVTVAPVVSERVDAPVEAVEVKTVVPPEPIAAQEVTVEPVQPEPELVVASPAKAVSSKKKG